MKYVSLIWAGIWRKRGRTILTVSQVLVAFTLFGLLQGMKSGIGDAVDKLSADFFIVQRADGAAPLPLAMYSRILAVPGVKLATYQSNLIATYQNPAQQIVAVVTDVPSSLGIVPGLKISKQAVEAMANTRTGMLVSDALARKYRWKVGDRIPLRSQTLRQDGSRTWTFDVVGLFTPDDQSLSSEYAVINYAYFDEARFADKGTVGVYEVKVADARQGVAVAQAIDRLFQNSADETRTESARETVQASLQSLGDLDFVIRAVVGSVLFALLFSTSAMMMQSIRERTPELAVLKTLGFSDSQVFWIVLTEALVTCVAAALMGLALAAWILPAARRFIRLDVSMPSSVFLAGVVIAVLLGILTAIVPAQRARRLQLVDALAGR